jgi:microcystin-dependent protein
MATYRPLIVNAAANQIQELASGDSLVGITTVTATTFIGAGTIPIGGIIMWSGTIANIPTPGWALCDGSNSTPDLRNRFIVGAHSGAGTGITSTTGPGFDASSGALSANYTPGNAGGTTAHKLTIAELASHTHNVTYSTGANSPASVDFTENEFGAKNTTQTSTDAGSDNYHENRPPYYALAFIMRTL